MQLISLFLDKWVNLNYFVVCGYYLNLLLWSGVFTLIKDDFLNPLLILVIGLTCCNSLLGSD